MIIVDVIQGTPEWMACRLGIPTASEFSNIITPAKGDYSKSATTYMHKLIAESLTGKEATGFMSDWMERGVEMEAEARSWYEFTRNATVRQVGFCYRDDRKDCGCSPDGLLDDRGLEIKCRSPGVMVGHLLDGGMGIGDIPQVQGGMMVTGLQFWDFLLYHPDFEPMLITVKRDNEYISKLEMYLARFNKERIEKLE